jgi:predicted unusual protein kinase regulating ubiquinone biosynthesis (AarF/ABC1/UbiB family)
MKKHEFKEVTFNLGVTVFRQGDVFVAYTPALDISTYGKSKAEAQKNFEELVDTFFSSFEDSRELGQVLESMGWTKEKTTWQPPKMEQKTFSVPAALMSA